MATGLAYDQKKRPKAVSYLIDILRHFDIQYLWDNERILCESAYYTRNTPKKQLIWRKSLRFSHARRSLSHRNGFLPVATIYAQ